MKPEEVAQRVGDWLQVMVVGEGLCPFAAKPLRDGLVRIAVCEARDEDGIYAGVLQEVALLLETPDSELETTVVAVPQGLGSFDAYLDMLASLEDALEELGLQGMLQIASFHPDYRFAETYADDLANFTNRSPCPLFHLLREESLSKALQSYPNPERIPQRNEQHMRELGREGIERLLRRAAPDRD